MKKWIVLLLALLVLGTAASALAAGPTTTLMMYMCGTDLQSDCVTDLKEMCAASLNGNVRIVVLAGGASKWDDRRLKAGRLNLFTIENGSFSAVTDWGSSSMGKQDTLQKFVNYAWENYPADRSMLVLWDHGGGMGDGVCFDEVHNDDGLTLVEIDQALAAVRKKHSDFHLAMMGCDACMMGGYEIAVVAAQYADYYIASEELEPWTGWYYTPWLNALAKDPGMSTADVGVGIIDAYIEGVKKDRATEYTTLSLIDAAALDSLRADLEQIAVYMSSALDKGQLATISRMLGRTYSFGTFESPNESWDMYDLADYLTICEQFAPNAVQSARANLEKCVIRSYTSGDVPTASGLAIYVPYSNRSYFLTEALDGYNLSAYMPNHVAFAKELAGTMGGSNYVFQASAPQSICADDDVFDDMFCMASAFFDLIPCGTYDAECDAYCDDDLPYFIAGCASQTAQVAGALPSFIAGSAGSSASTGNLPGFIAGSAGSLEQPQTTTSIGIGNLPGFIAGNAGSLSETVQAPTNSLAFTLDLGKDAVDNLSYVEGALFMDISDDDGVYLLDLGYTRNSWVDWNTYRVYSAFDGTWSYLEDQLVVLYEQSRNEASRRCLIPVKVNGQNTYLVVLFEGSSATGRILGYNDGVDANGLPIRRTTPLETGDVIVPVYTMLYNTWEDWETPDVDPQEIVFDGDRIFWNEDLTVTFETLADEEDPSDYQFAFFLNDIFGDYEMSDFFPFTM